MARPKKVEEEKREKAFFSQRLLAFLIDVIIVTVISSALIFPVTNTESLEKLTNQNKEISNNYLDKKINTETYISQSMDLTYEIAKQNGVGTIITIIVYILYYVVFQFYKKGQTIGKMLMRIKVDREDKKELTLNNLLFRSFIINFILVDIIMLLFMLFAGKTLYTNSIYVFESIQYTVIFVTCIMALYRKDGRGIHDLISGTRVIKCEVKERVLEACES